jgi:putative endonuclease
MPDYNYFVYITTNSNRTVLYVGVTNDLSRRLEEHYENSKNRKTFAGLYYCFHLIYFERHSRITHAIEREKEIKKWSRKKKEVLINEFNPQWRFLNQEIQE